MIENTADIWSYIDSRVRFGIKPGLERMRAFLERLGLYNEHPRVIHVAGTNGKGSLCYVLDQLLGAGGASTGLYVSPHILQPAERIRVNGRALSDEQMLSAWRELEALLPELEPSYFELLTALALLAFRQAGVQWWILECGLGGRFDATNALEDHELAIITSVDLDHTHVLGNSLEAIAADKAGIARRGRPLLLLDERFEVEQAVRRVCIDLGANLLPIKGVAQFHGEQVGELLQMRHASGEVLLDAPGEIWRQSLRHAALALDLLKELPAGQVKLDTSGWPGRMDLRRAHPPLLLDVAHNPAAIARLCAELEALAPGPVWTLLMCVMSDKDADSMLESLRPHCRLLHPLALRHQRVLSAEELASRARRCGLAVGESLTPEQLPAPDAIGKSSFAEPSLVCGSFLAVSAWLKRSSLDLPPGL